MTNPQTGVEEKFENDRLARYDKTSEPVHLGAGVVKRWNKDKTVLLCLSMVDIFRDAGREHVVVGEKD